MIKRKKSIYFLFRFCEALDSLKTGRTIKQQVYSSDAAKFNCEGPSYKISLSPNNKSKPDSNELPLRRGQGLHPFIMDILNIFIKHECDIQTKLVEDTLKNVPGFDIDLVAPWEDAWVRAEKACAERMLFDMKDQLKLIKEHVKKTYEKWQTNRGQVSKMAATKARSGSGSGSGSGGKSGFTNAPIEARQDALRKLSRYFSMFPERNKLECFSEREILTLKASYAYKFDYDIRAGSSVRWSRFPWDVALGELCAIKARAQGQCKTVSMDFYEAFKIHSRFRKSMT